MVSRQLPLFTDSVVVTDDPDPITLLRKGAALVLSVSGGKDSDATSHHLLDLRQREGWSGSVTMVHADLGRAEWATTPAYVRDLATRKGVELAVVRWEHGDLIDRIWARWETLKGAGCPWPSAKLRFCTSDMKRAPISRWLRNRFQSGQVICAMGLRAGESPARAKRPCFQLRTDSSAPTKRRFVWDWLPIHHWAETDVWDCIHAHGSIYHPAYDLGNQRLSCSLCILGSLNDLINGAVHQADIYREYCRIEAVTGYSFRPDLWLSDLKPELLPESTRNAIQHHKATR